MKTLLIYIFTVLPLFGLSEKVSLQLKWFHQFQFAGYYIAKEKGFYEDVGLNVEIIERDLSKDNVQQVINGEAEYGISDSVLFIYKANGKPIVLISPIFQHSPNVVITKKSSGLDSPYKLNNKRVIFYKKDVDGINILSMFKAIGITPDIMRIKDKKDPSLLLSGFADGYSGYITNEPFFFKKRGVGYNTIFPAHYGFDFYGDILFTSEEEAKNRPDRVKRFREATIKGWNYALDHLEESIEIIHKKYAKNRSIEHLRYEAKGISSLINRELFPLGQFDVGRVEFILNQYKNFNLIDNNRTADDYIFKEYRESEPILSEDDVEWLQKHKGIKIAVPLGLEPVIIKRQDGSFDGILVDYFKALSSLIGYKIELTPFNLAKENSLSASHKNSVYGDALILENSQYSDQFLKTVPYLETKLEVFTREELLSNIRSLDDLKNRRVAILKGNITIKKYVESGEINQIIETNSIKEQFNLLYSDEVDAVVGYSNYNYIIKKENLKTISLAFKTDYSIGIHIGINPEYEVLKDILNRAIERLGNEFSHQVVSKWFQDSSYIFALLTKNERDFLLKNREIKMCIDPDWMPFEKFENGEYIGITADYIEKLEKILGTEITPVQTKNWAESLQAGKDRECDIFSLVMPTEERRKFLDFTEPYINVPLVLATDLTKPFVNDITSITDEEIGIVKGYAYGEILRKTYPNMKLIDVENVKDGLEKVLHGELFGFIGTLPTLGWNIQNEYLGQLKITGKFSETWNLGIGVRNDIPILRDIFDKALKSISPDEQQAIINKWISISYQKSRDYIYIFQWIGSVISIFSIILFIVIRVNRRLNIEIEKREIVERELQNYISLVDRNVVISSTDLNGFITDVSKAFEELTGYKKSELIGKEHSILRHQDTPKEFYKDMWDTLEKGEIWSGEIKNVKKDDSTYWASATISPIYNLEGKK